MVPLQKTPAIKIVRSNPLPLYAQLRQSILELIETNHLSPGCQLPPEEELVAMTGLSRFTVRQALDELEKEGRVKRVHGKGTFVSEPKVGLSVAYKLLGFSEDMTRKGHHVRSRVLEMGLSPAPDDVAQALTISSGSPVVRLKRLRTLDGEPFMIDMINVRADLCPGLEAVDFTDESLFHILEDHYGLRIARARRTLHIVVADPESASLLGVSKGSPLHLLTDLAFIENGEPVEFAYTLVHAGRSEFTFDLVRDPEPGQYAMTIADSANPILRRETP
ncbi:MAG: GntR family transcriptional regulator [Anaerolineae bacterium]|nr:GntR family transcriptional regulator [Anaerolineae bacterium]